MKEDACNRKRPAYLFMFFSIQEIMSLHTIHSSGMLAFVDRSQRYPR